MRRTRRWGDGREKRGGRTREEGRREGGGGVKGQGGGEEVEDEEREEKEREEGKGEKNRVQVWNVVILFCGVEVTMKFLMGQSCNVYGRSPGVCMSCFL